MIKSYYKVQKRKRLTTDEIKKMARRKKPRAAVQSSAPMGSWGDLNFIDNNFTIQAHSGTIPTLLNGCIQGSTQYNRYGRKINMKNINITFYFQPNENLDTIRCALVYQLKPNGVAPAITDVWIDTIAGNSRNIVNLENFKVLKDWMFILPETANVVRKPTKKFMKLELPTEFNLGNAGTIGDMVHGALWFFAYTERALAANTTNIRVVSRIRFQV